MRLYLTIATACGGLALSLWAFFAWQSVGFAMGARNTADGRLGGFFILLLTLGIGLMVLAASLFLGRHAPPENASTVGPEEEEIERPDPRKPFEKVWEYSTIGVLFGALVVIPVLRNLYGGSRSMDAVTAVAIGLPLVSFGLLGIYSGRMSNEDADYSRERNPVVFWLWVSGSLAVGLGALLFAAGFIP